MPNLTSSDLLDPQPPMPGERERTLVATRAHELGRRRRLVQGGGALALVAAVAVSVAALTAGGSSGPGGTNGIAAASGSDTSVSTPVSDATGEPAAPITFTLSGTVAGNPADTTVNLHLSGPGGEHAVNVDGAGNFSISGLDAGDYEVIGQWTDSTNTATGAEKFGTVSIANDASVSFTFSS